MLIVNAVVFDGREFQKGLHLRLEGGVIVETGEFLSPGEGEEVLDLGGDFLVPGFVDVHIHAFRGHDTMDGEEAVRAMSRDLAELGVAAFCPTTMSASLEETKNALRGIRQIMKRPEENGARILGAHMEAPFLREERAGAQRKEFFRDPSWEDFLWMTDGHPEIVSLITLAPERVGSEDFIRKAAAAGIHVSIGHTSADAETVHAAADWGADHVTHTFNAQTPVHHRKPGVPGAAMTDGRGASAPGHRPPHRPLQRPGTGGGHHRRHGGGWHAGRRVRPRRPEGNRAGRSGQAGRRYAGRIRTDYAESPGKSDSYIRYRAGGRLRHVHRRSRGVRPRNSRRADNSRSAGHSDPLDPRMEARRRDPGIIRLQQTVMKKTAAEAAARPSTNLWKQGFVFYQGLFL